PSDPLPTDPDWAGGVLYADEWSRAVPAPPAALWRLRVGDTLGSWRVEEVVPGRLLRLRAETRLPGQAWLELTCREEHGRTVYGQRAIFHPRGLLGHLYWWTRTPFRRRRVPGDVVRRLTRAS
ncbi:DUF2867 domain-containing protein, partial [Nonomuraea aridisoli]